jgi:hypothetical protein
MRRKVIEGVLVAAVLAGAPIARAQPMVGGGGRMPDLSQIVGRPLPDGGMPTGTVSVRVSRKMPVNAVAGAEVSAIIKNAGGDLRRRALKTDDGGRVLFEGMAPGDQFHAEVTVDGEHLESQTFTIPSEGGIKTMLISGVGSGGGRGGAADSAPAEGEAPAGGGEQRAFSLGATAGVAQEDASLPAGTLDLNLVDEREAPIANHPVVLGMVNKQGEVETRRAQSDGAGHARFTDLPTGKQTGYAAVIEWHGLRLNTAPFGMPETGGARATIRALTRTADPSAITIGQGARIVVQMAEDRLQILEFLPLENTSDKMFDPGPGALEIPLPTGFTGAQPQENDRKIDVRPEHGIAVHGPIVPRRSQLGESASERQADEVVFGFEVHYYGDSFAFKQPVPNGIGPFTLITDQKVAGLTLSGPGVGAREERVLNGRKYWMMSGSAVPPGGAITFTINGLPSTDTSGRITAGILSVLLIIATFVFARKPGGASASKRTTAEEQRARLKETREALYADLVAMERTARAAGVPAPVDRREQLVRRLEEVYQEIAALNESRAA